MSLDLTEDENGTRAPSPCPWTWPPALLNGVDGVDTAAEPSLSLLLLYRGLAREREEKRREVAAALEEGEGTLGKEEGSLHLILPRGRRLSHRIKHGESVEEVESYTVTSTGGGRGTRVGYAARGGEETLGLSDWEEAHQRRK